MTNTKDNLQKTVYELIQVTKNYNLTISTQHSKVSFKGQVWSKIVLINVILEQVNNFKYFGNELNIKYKLNNITIISIMNSICKSKCIN